MTGVVTFPPAPTTAPTTVPAAYVDSVAVPVTYAAGISAQAVRPATTVTYNGSLYVCTVAHVTTASFDAGKWLLIVSKGDQGTPGADATSILTESRNRLRNPQFNINVRGLAGTVVLAAGQYGHDGVKGGASGCTYTFAASGVDTIITISAGSLIMPIEDVLIEGGTYTLANSGSAQARIWQGTGSTGTGSYAACPQTVVGLTPKTQTNVEFSTGTVYLPSFEPGNQTLVFVRRNISLERIICQTYCLRVNLAGTIGVVNSTTSVAIVQFLRVSMRVSPTVTGSPSFTSVNNGSNQWQIGAAFPTNLSPVVSSITLNANSITIQVSGWTGLTVGNPVISFVSGAFYECSSEI